MDSFTYHADAVGVVSNSATVTLEIRHTNALPVVGADTFEVNEDDRLLVAADVGVLLNDVDPDGSPLTAVLESGPAHGTLALNADGSLDYLPEPDFFGVDTFTYRANDGSDDSDVAATVTIMVNAVDDSPTANYESYTVIEDGSLTVAAVDGVLANDTDPDGDTLSTRWLGGPVHGVVTLATDGSFTYVPDADFSGTDRFVYRAVDGTRESYNATVSIIVNPAQDLPVATDDEYTVERNGSLQVDAALGLLDNDSDIDDDPLTARIAVGPTKGDVTVGADGSFLYTPNVGVAVGVDQFTYYANDGVDDSTPATVTIHIVAANTPPLGVADIYTAVEDDWLIVSAVDGVLANDTDAEPGALSAVLEAAPTHGRLFLYHNGAFSYRSDRDYSGPDSFTYRAGDGQYTSSPVTVSLTVNPTNDRPLAQTDYYEVGEDSLLSINAAEGLLANDSDAEGAALTAALNAGPIRGSVELADDGSFFYRPNADFTGVDHFSYHANDGQDDSNTVSVIITVRSGADQFTYTAFDGQLHSVAATVSLDVRPMDDRPVAANDAYALLAVDAGSSLHGCVLDNDSDIDGDTLTARLLLGPSDGTLVWNADGTFDYTPRAGFLGYDHFSYTAGDGQTDSNAADVTIAVMPPVPPPGSDDRPSSGGPANGAVETRSSYETSLLLDLYEGPTLREPSQYPVVWTGPYDWNGPFHADSLHGINLIECVADVVGRHFSDPDAWRPELAGRVATFITIRYAAGYDPSTIAGALLVQFPGLFDFPDARIAVERAIEVIGLIRLGRSDSIGSDARNADESATQTQDELEENQDTTRNDESEGIPLQSLWSDEDQSSSATAASPLRGAAVGLAISAGLFTAAGRPLKGPVSMPDATTRARSAERLFAYPNCRRFVPDSLAKAG